MKLFRFHIKLAVQINLYKLKIKMKKIFNWLKFYKTNYQINRPRYLRRKSLIQKLAQVGLCPQLVSLYAHTC